MAVLATIEIGMLKDEIRVSFEHDVNQEVVDHGKDRMTFYLKDGTLLGYARCGVMILVRYCTQASVFKDVLVVVR